MELLQTLVEQLDGLTSSCLQLGLRMRNELRVALW